MTDTKSPRTATEGAWALPLMVLVPLAAIRLLAEPSTPWLAISWVLCALSALLVAAGWATVFRRGTRGSAAWGTCILVHAVLAWQLIALVGQ
ncbi:hypothetical protein OH805_23360 [Streptomyces sp. NBC_00879]|uniref:hypothetical protein n=1 Tax=Streptomyces sp. NBC_00879 TaxID=2975855 RepID=UPI00386E5202|nr:hypothetical protein OH805_23360 [Streptomyces sp. NBC_00879]